MELKQIKENLLDLIAESQSLGNRLLAEMPVSGDSRREKSWREYQRVRALQSTLQEAFEKLTN